MRQTSELFRRATSAQESAENLIPLIELSHPSWPQPERLARHDKAILHQGHSFAPAAFEISLPDDAESGTPVMNWAIDNTDLRLVAALRSARNEVLAKVMWVLVSQPDIVEAGPFETELLGAEFDETVLTGPLTVEPILQEPFTSLKMTPMNAPGLF